MKDMCQNFMKCVLDKSLGRGCPEDVSCAVHNLKLNPVSTRFLCSTFNLLCSFFFVFAFSFCFSFYICCFDLIFSIKLNSFS